MLDVASSRIRIRGSDTIVLAKARSWRFTVGKTGTALADLGVVAVRQFYDKVMGMHGSCGGNDFFLRGIELSIRNVVADRAGEEKVVLGHNAHLGTQAVDGDIRQAVVIDADRSRSNIVETADQIDNGRLSSAGRARRVRSSHREPL